MWKDLSMKEKSAYMKVAVKLGIYNLDNIRNYYNKFEMGGPMEGTPLSEDGTPLTTEEKILRIHPELKGRIFLRRPKSPSKEEIENAKKRDVERAKEIARQVNLFQSAMNRAAEPTNFGNKYKEASDRQVEERKEKVHLYKLGINSIATAAELASSAYMLGKGAKALNLLPNNRIINSIYQSDTGQVIANTLGTAADGYLLLTTDDNREKIENSIELPADIAGIIGGTNWFRNTNFFGRYGNKIDNVLDFAGYSAAGYDAIFKPLNYLLDEVNKK